MEKDLNKTNEIDADQLSDVSGGALCNVTESNTTTINETQTSTINVPMTKYGDGDQISVGNNFSAGSNTSGIDSFKKLSSLFEKLKDL